MMVWIALLLPASASAQLAKDTDKKVCQAELEKNYLTKRMVALVSFPASADGIDLSLDGTWDQKETSRRTKKSGGGIDIDDAATVTQVKLKDNLLEIQLNGGGFGTFGDFLSSSEKQRQERSVTGKASGGSRINLRFNRAIDCATLADASAMMGFLAPLVRTDALKQQAALKSIPQEWAEAAAQRRVVVGMDKTTIFAIFGEPKQKQVDMVASPPTEKWQYDLPDLKTRIITFQNGKVTKVDEF
jgi:hypothetical protein